MSMASRVSAKLVYKPLKKDSNILLICEVRNSSVSAKERAVALSEDQKKLI